MFIVYCLLFIVYCLLFIVYCLLFIVFCFLFFVFCFLFFVFCFLFFVFCFLFFVFCFLFFVFCFLFFVYCYPFLGIRSRMGKGDPDLRRITETFLGALWRLSSIYIAFEPRFLYFKGRLSWGMGKDKKALKRFATGLEIAGKHQLLLDSALINLAIGERLAVKKERDAALESAKNMLWICDAMAYWESPGEVVEGGEGGEIEGDRGEALKKHSGSDKKLQVKKDTSKRKEKGGKEESSLQQVFASLVIIFVSLYLFLLFIYCCFLK